jgi:quinol monooxygenase YgiN
MIAAFLKANVRPEKNRKLLEFLKWDCQVARDDEPATLRFDVFEDPNDDSVVYFYEAYVDEAGLEDHKLGEPFKAWIGGLMDECVESLEGIVPGWTTAFCTTAE